MKAGIVIPTLYHGDAVGNDAVGMAERLRRRGHAVQLLPENPDFEPIEVDLRNESLVIEGIAVGVIRNGRGL